MEVMSREEWREFVLAGTRTAKAGYSYVMITGQATLSSDLAEVRRWATVLGSRYMGADRAGEYGARNGVPGEYLVRVTPAKVVARRGIAD
jgi:hypothetical protein